MTFAFEFAAVLHKILIYEPSRGDDEVLALDDEDRRVLLDAVLEHRREAVESLVHRVWIGGDLRPSTVKVSIVDLATNRYLTGGSPVVAHALFDLDWRPQEVVLMRHSMLMFRFTNDTDRERNLHVVVIAEPLRDR